MTQSDIINENFSKLKARKVSVIQDFEVNNDSKLFGQIADIKRSTFDRSKFTVIGTPTITADGIASGFEQNNYIKFSGMNIDKPWKIKLKVKTPTALSSSYSQAICGFGAGSSWADRFCNRLYLNSSRHIIMDLTFTGTSFEGKTSTLTVDLDKEYYIEWYWTGSDYLLDVSEDGVNFTNYCTITNSNPVYKIAENYYIGIAEVSYSWRWDGSIDLKQFSITVDGVEVFSGNKTGIDQIKKDDFEIVGSPTAENGVYSNFSTSNYLKTKQVDLSKASKWRIDLPLFKLNNWAESGAGAIQIFASITNYIVGLAVNNGSHKVSMSVGNADNTSWISTNSTQDIETGIFYQGYIEFTGSAYNLYLSTDYGRTYELWCTRQSTDKVPFVENSEMVFGQGRTVATSTSYQELVVLDMSSCKFYVNDELVYLPALYIPYTQSKAGSKIVDIAYRDRVKAMYEQFDRAPYYTLSDIDFTLPLGEIYSLAGGGSSGDADSTKNQNTASSIDRVYDWVGTKSEWESQNIASRNPEWICYITDDFQEIDVEEELRKMQEQIDSFIGPFHVPDWERAEDKIKGTNYTAEEDGWIYWTATGIYSSTQYSTLIINGIIVDPLVYTSGSVTNSRIFTPIKAGDTYYGRVPSSGASSYALKFIPIRK